MNAPSVFPRDRAGHVAYLKGVAPAAVRRYALACLFLWFGTRQLLAPSEWVAFVPDWTGRFALPAMLLVRLNGMFEVVAAGMLAAGAYTRLAAFFLGAHLAAIAASLGGPIGVRDGVLAAVTLALAAEPPDAMTLDAHVHAARPFGAKKPR